MSFFANLFKEKSALSRYGSELEMANSYTEEVKKLSQSEIQEEIKSYKTKASEIKDLKELFSYLKEIAPRVFAVTREATDRTTGKPHYDVQMVGGFALAEGKIAEMKTGEGKTQTAILALALYSLAGRGAHLVTVNDYLARWQASLMGPIFNYLGLSVASIQHEACTTHLTRLNRKK
jgi:preprotein translocase subunit SecA